MEIRPGIPLLAPHSGPAETAVPAVRPPGQGIAWCDRQTPEIPHESDVPDSFVHLACNWEPEMRKRIRAAMGFTLTSLSITGEGVLLIALLVFLALFGVFRELFTPGLTILAFVPLLLLVFILTARSESRRLDPSPVYPTTSDSRFRVRVVGSPDRLDRLRHLPSDPAASFEPEAFRITCALEPKGRRRLKLFLLCAACWILLMSVDLVIWPVQPAAGAHLAIACALGRFSRAFLWPTYLRVSPGRLDVFQYRFLGLGTPSVRTFDLRTSRVALEIRGSLIVFPEGAETGELFPSGSAAPFDPGQFEFERTILAAALTTAPTPPLPDDRLIG